MTERFIKKQDHWLDTKTNLEWSVENYDPMTWHEAIAKFDGSSDWRLPTIEELNTLVDYSIYEPSTELADMISSFYWSSTTYAYGTDYAWFVSFYVGYDSDYPKIGHNYVRAVRGEGRTKMTELNPCLNTTLDP